MRQIIINAIDKSKFDDLVESSSQRITYQIKSEAKGQHIITIVPVQGWSSNTSVDEFIVLIEKAIPNIIKL